MSPPFRCFRLLRLLARIAMDAGADGSASSIIERAQFHPIIERAQFSVKGMSDRPHGFSAEGLRRLVPDDGFADGSGALSGRPPPTQWAAFSPSRLAFRSAACT